MKIEDIDIDDPKSMTGKSTIQYTDTIGGQIPKVRIKTTRNYTLDDISGQPELIELLMNEGYSPTLVSGYSRYQKNGYIVSWSLDSSKDHIKKLTVGIRDADPIRKFIISSQEMNIDAQFVYVVS